METFIIFDNGVEFLGIGRIFSKNLKLGEDFYNQQRDFMLKLGKVDKIS